MFDECKPIAQISVHPAMAEHHPEPANSGVDICLAKHTMNKRNWIDSQDHRSSGRPMTNRRHKYKSTFMKKGFSQQEIACFYKHLNRKIDGVNLSSNTVLADSFGGAVNRKQMLEETSSPQRDSCLKLQFIATWEDPAQDDGQIRWMRDFYTELYAASGATAKYTGTPFWATDTKGAISTIRISICCNMATGRAILRNRQPVSIPAECEAKVRPQQYLPSLHVHTDMKST